MLIFYETEINFNSLLPVKGYKFQIVFNTKYSLYYVNIKYHTVINIKNRLQFPCLFNFQSHHPLRLLLLQVNYIHLKDEILSLNIN